MFRLKPTRMTVSDLRPSLSYRLGVDTGSRTSLHWVELALATDPKLFSLEGASRRAHNTFVTFRQRFAIRGSDAILHVPPAALLALAGGNRIYAGAALFGARLEETPLAVIRPDAQSIYVAADGFTGAGVHQRFGFTGRPAITGDAPVSNGDGTLRWAGDLPEPGSVPASAAPETSTHSSQSGPSLKGVRIQTEGPSKMNQSQGFMHKSVHHQNHVPPQPAQPNGNGQATAPVMDYDDGYGTPPAPMPPTQNGQGQGADGQNGSERYGNGSWSQQIPATSHPPVPVHAAPGAAQPQPLPVAPQQRPQAMPAMPGYQQQPPQPVTVAPGHQPPPQQAMPGGAPAVASNGAPPDQQAMQQAYVRPLDYALPVFDSYNPMDILRKLQEMWERYESFSAGVANATSFPFSAIVAINSFFQSKSNPNAVADACGTGFYIGPNLILTVAHNFAADSDYNAAHTATLYAGLNSTQDVGASPQASDALGAETIDPSTAVTIHPNYFSSDPAVSQAHDIAVVRTTKQAPTGQFFRIANFSPAGDQKIAVCGYGASSSSQHDSYQDWRDLLPPAQRDWKQHLDADMIRDVVNGGEGIYYNAQTLSGNSGSPVFLKPDNVAGEDPTELMQVIAVHSQGAGNFYNHGVLLTPDKRDWALSGGTMAVQQSYYSQDGQYSRPMVAPPTWGPIVASLVGSATTAGIAGLQSGSGDLTWSLQKMDGWLPAGGHPTPTITVDRSTLHTERNVEINSPVWQGTVQGNMYAHFYLDFQYDGTGVGGITIEPQPYASHDNLTGGMRIDMQITPLLETFPSHIQGGAPVACVEVKMMYTYEWTVSDSDQVTVVYRLYGDGTYESSVRGGTARLDATDTTYTPHRR